MSWLNAVNGDSLAWLLEPDPVNPGVRLFALRDWLDQPADDAVVAAAQAAVMRSGPVPAILDAQHPDGYWHKPGGGYGKYRGTAFRRGAPSLGNVLVSWAVVVVSSWRSQIGA